MTSPTPAPNNPRPLLTMLRSKRLQSICVLVLLVAILIIARDQMHFIGEGWRQLRKADFHYVVLGAVFIALSMVAQAEVMVVLLRSAGVRVKRRAVNILCLAANAWSSSFPGGPALSMAMIFREQMKWGATAVIASWYMVMSGALSSAGMALLAIGAVFFLGLDVKPQTLALSLLGLLAVAWATNWIANHPQKVSRWLVGAGRAWARGRKQPEEKYTSSIQGLVDQLSAVKLPLPHLLQAMIPSMLNWILEIACLAVCIIAVGGQPPIAGVVLSFLASKLVGQAQITPGGLGPVDVALTSSLVGFGEMSSAQAFAAVIVYRMLGFVGLTIVGWVVYFTAKIAKPIANMDPLHAPPMPGAGAQNATKNQPETTAPGVGASQTNTRSHHAPSTNMASSEKHAPPT